MALLALLSSVACLATPVQTVDNAPVVRVGAITGYITSGYDVVHGRFSLHVGSWRTPNGLTQKIPWYVRRGAGAGPAIALTATRVAPLPRKTFRQIFASAGSNYPQGTVYPSIIDPPSTGCWRLTMRTGRVSATFTALVRDRPGG